MSKARCPECGNESLVNVYTNIMMYVELDGDGVTLSQKYEGGEFDETYCNDIEVCGFNTSERTYQEHERLD